MKAAKVRNISTLARFLAGVPLRRLVVSQMLPRCDGKSAIGLPVVENFGVDPRSRSSASTVHTGYAGWKMGGVGADQAGEQKVPKKAKAFGDFREVAAIEI